MGHSFSSLYRKQIVEQLQQDTYDLIVIGGGVTGAGIALDGVVRGLKVALLDMQDFAAGTSSRSTKLVHGGLRYLKQGEIKLVREVGRERAIVHANAQHVVTPEWMLMPIIKGGTYGRLTSSIGILLYDFLAGVKKHERRRMLSKKETLAKAPLLRSDDLIGGGYYVEYRTDDARLTIEIMKEAVNRGAIAMNYIEVQDFIYSDGKIIGVRAQDHQTSQEVTVRASQIVNAAGPWVDTLREIDHSKRGKQLHLTKGVHLVIDHSRFPLEQAIYFDTEDKRMLFAIPRDGKTYVGTTDTNYTGNIASPFMTAADREYLLASTNARFPSLLLTAQDVESSWAGIRPLIHEEGKAPSELSRKDELIESPSGLITIAGGKLTGYRKMAERIVDLVTSRLSIVHGRTYPSCTTDQIRLSGGTFEEDFQSFMDKWIQIGMEYGLSPARSAELVQRYGSNVEQVFAHIKPMAYKAYLLGIDSGILAALRYGMDHEMVTHPLDFLSRRSSAINFNHNEARKWIQPVIRYMAEVLKWDNNQTALYKSEAEEAFRMAREVAE
ncbi:glycerol-3-phosphate dehydrogenase/oxidase [Paenibacillus sp. N1-5-1-14]|uniref:glycerol-3-phosphate dehydrogenase/oxidase n=1 Tax=Paenibacillus radicibacter TaxID=2972488 RepID=UPI002159AF7F|nr:glycerol-3-phosphate dehydrogenase/oxidase [Paenibacillus radicibacter]MCR8644048.1 glycerol-3-phosphate dehydrogenase/oxidase [Paenibacillus radicibacter]